MLKKSRIPVNDNPMFISRKIKVLDLISLKGIVYHIINEEKYACDGYKYLTYKRYDCHFELFDFYHDKGYQKSQFLYSWL